MDDTAHRFFKTLLETPSPSGFEQPIQAVIREYAGGFADATRTDSHGNVYATRFPAGRPDSAPRVMLAGHCDQIGLMVQHVDAEGFLYVQPIGGWDVQILLGQHLTVWGKDGPLRGVVSRKAIHLLKPEERNKVPDFTDIWVDIGAKTKDEAEQVVRAGDPVTLELGYRPLRNNLAASPAMDDKVGVFVVMEALRHLKGRELNAAVTSVSTVAEEIGLRGATTATYSVNPHVGIAVDVCHATDTPGGDKKQLGDIKCGGGPVVYRGPNMNPHVVNRLLAAGKAKEIPIQLAASGRATPTDANVLQTTRAGVATGLVSVPNRYMHSAVETISLDDADRTADLLAAFVRGLEGPISWAP